MTTQQRRCVNGVAGPHTNECTHRPTAASRRDTFQELVRTSEGDLTPAQERRQRLVQRHRRVCATWLALLLAGSVVLPTIITQPHRPPTTQETA